MSGVHVSLLPAALLILTLALGASPSASQKGFQSINCGGEAYIDPITNITWEADPLNNNNNELLYGRNTTLNSSLKNISMVLRSLRYFPNDNKRNRKFCYSLPASYNSTYLLRASFLYGNYDGLHQPPKFFLILNWDKWIKVNTSSSTTPIMHELTFVHKGHDLNICLAPYSNDTPFISTLEIRTLKSAMYIRKTGGALLNNFGLMLWRRINYGARTDSAIRYPDDPYDRIWEADTTGPALRMNSSQASNNYTLDPEEPPAEVMATARTSEGGDLSFTFKGYGGTQGFRLQMHFEDPVHENLPTFTVVFPSPAGSAPIPQLVPAPRSASLDQELEFPVDVPLLFVPDHASSPRGPLLNAIELFHWTPQQLFTICTFQGDVDTIKTIQTYFKLSGYGQGDPCMPEDYGWTWIVCNTDLTPRIVQINLASFNLIGDIPSSINNLTKLQKIDLSNNNLSGEIPKINNLLDLEYLDLHNNHVTGELSSSLISLPKLATLDVSYNDLCGSSPPFLSLTNYNKVGNKRLCDDVECPCGSGLPKGSNNKTKYIVSISILGALYIAAAFALLIFYMARRHTRTKGKKSPSHKEGVDDFKGLPFTTKMFTFKEISDATLNFTTLLGEGGFGKVYHGLLPMGEAIAVKMLDNFSKQGLKEFYNEVVILSRVHHKNLVSLLGFCVENSYMLIYEYIAKGNLRDLIYGDMESIDRPLPWKTRLQIGLDASQGLEYLHTGCESLIIHRDVKSSNILLSEKMQAKVSDFGLSRLKEGNNTTSHVSTLNVVGTAGYLDPAYNATNQLTDKSDVYSFGIVLFELICGRAPIDTFNIPSYIVDWASQSYMQGKLKEIVDPMLANGYKMESMQKVVDLAFGCVESDRTKRPTMSQVSQIIQSALEIEKDEKSLQDASGTSSTSDGKVTILD